MHQERTGKLYLTEFSGERRFSNKHLIRIFCLQLYFYCTVVHCTNSTIGMVF
jgi:hypothetical protein